MRASPDGAKRIRSMTATRAVVAQLDALGPFVEFCDRISPNQLKPKNGYIELPTAPGLGVDVDEDALRKFPGKPYALRKLRHPADEAGGI